MAAFLRKYATATAAGTHIRIPIIKRDVRDFAVSADWTPAAGDVKISKDGGTQANIGTLPTYSNGDWLFVFTGTELTAKSIEVRIVDSATKAIEDAAFNIETYDHASALHPEIVQTGDSFARIGATGSGLTSLASQASVNTVDDLLDTEIGGLISTLGAAGAGLTAIPWNAAWDAEVQSEAADALNAYDPPTNAEMDARTLPAADYATAAALTIVDDFIDTELAAILAAVDTEIAAIKAKTDNLPSDPADESSIQGTLTNLAAALTTVATYIDTEVAAIKAKTDTIADVYHADIQFTRDQSSTQDEYVAVWFKNGVRVTSGITVPTLQVVKRVDGTDLIASTAMTQIGSTGAYKLTTAVSGERQTVGEAVLVIAGATIDAGARSFARALGRDST